MMCAMGRSKTSQAPPAEAQDETAGADKKVNSVEAVKVAIRILDELALAQRAMGVTELAESLGETKPRVHRHLSTLREVGLIEQEQATERYRLGWRLFQLGEAAGTQFDLRRRAEPYLVRIRDELRETAVLAVPVNGRPMVIATAENVYARICVTVKPGNRPHPNCSALGRLTLAFSPPAVQEEVLAGELVAETPSSMTDPAKLRKRLTIIREQFYEACDSEMLVGINTLAVPIFRAGGSLAGALSIVGSVQNIPNPPLRKQVEFLQACASELSSQLNGTDYEEWQLRRRVHEAWSKLK
jgi:IclR family transcriptional regulator, KDG regulon repressor